MFQNPIKTMVPFPCSSENDGSLSTSSAFLMSCYANLWIFFSIPKESRFSHSCYWNLSIGWTFSAFINKAFTFEMNIKYILVSIY